MEEKWETLIAQGLELGLYARYIYIYIYMYLHKCIRVYTYIYTLETSKHALRARNGSWTYITGLYYGITLQIYIYIYIYYGAIL